MNKNLQEYKKCLMIFGHNLEVLVIVMIKNKSITEYGHKIVTEVKVIYTKYSKHSNETNTFMGLGRAGRFGQS